MDAVGRAREISFNFFTGPHLTWDNRPWSAAPVGPRAYPRAFRARLDGCTIDDMRSCPIRSIASPRRRGTMAARRTPRTALVR